MKYSVSEVIQYVREEDVKFIRLAFCDISGRQRNMAIMPYELERAFTFGMPVDPTAITGFGAYGPSELYLHPDPSTLAQLPWRPESGRVIRMFCNITHADGTPFEADMRALLSRTAENAAAKRLSFEFGTSMEFYLFKNDEEGNPTKIPHHNAGYMDIAPIDRGENVRREIQLNMERMGIQPESSHHEEGPGQNEIDFVNADPLSCADNAVTFVSVVKTIAARNGLTADFSPKPVPELPGSGLHVSMAVNSADGRDHLDAVSAGIISKIREMTVFLDPLDNSYERFGQNKAPKYISWSEGDRSHLMRIPKAPDGKRMAELRSPDPMSNPYIVFTLLLSAGLYGIEHELRLPDAICQDLYSAPDSVRRGLATLPLSLKEAENAAGNSDFIRSVLPESVIDFYCKRS